MGLLKEFKDFAMKGNVLDLAVGVIIGAEFGKIVNSLVNDVLMPPLGAAIGGMNFKDLAWKLGVNGPDGKVATLNYGNFIQACINFAIIAFTVFLIVKAKNMAEKRLVGVTDPAAPPPPPEDVMLLREIRDELKKRP
ncbi:MAG TPA: large-conductance mechanosensitive channel protein MscL [Caulifigura sp.]|jgi:large conductance mechanosensitive channel|nr:large-conductance mechanosensitive channel protein MscL [Caulifigura sp.]